MLTWGSLRFTPGFMLPPAPQAGLTLREYSSQPRRFGHAIDGQNVSPGAHVRAVSIRGLIDLLKRIAHGVFQSLVDALLAPEEGILILNPFVITYRHAARVREDVGNQHHSPIFKHAIRRRSRWSISEFRDYLRFHIANVAHRDAVLKSRRTQDVAINFEHVVRRDLFHSL